jgi:hypothetical protein
VGVFGRRLRQQRDQHYQGDLSVGLSDGDEGLERVRDNEFGEAIWILDRWHLSPAVRRYVGNDQREYHRLMAGVYRSDSVAVLAALRESSPVLRR